MAMKMSSVKMLVVLLIVLALVPVISMSMARTSTTNYCMSCHEMKSHKSELEKSSHAFDKDKKPIECAQCHLPNSFGLKYVAVKVYLGARDMMVHYLGDPNNLDRRKMQQIARRFILDDNCRACHQDLSKNAKGEKISEIGKLCHDAYLGINGSTKSRCVGCHFNVAHLPDFDRRYFFNAKFAKRLQEGEKKR